VFLVIAVGKSAGGRSDEAGHPPRRQAHGKIRDGGAPNAIGRRTGRPTLARVVVPRHWPPMAGTEGQPAATTAAPRRRRGWRWFLAMFLLIIGGLMGAVWWALDTNQLGMLIERGFRNRLPGHLTVGRTEVMGVDRVVLSGVILSASAGGPPLATVERIVVTGELWKGHVDLVAIDGVKAFLDAENVRFLHRLIRAEVAIKPTSAPRLIHLDFTGEVLVEGKPVLTAARTAVDATGPMAAVTGSCTLLGREPIALTINSEKTGDDIHTRIALKQGRLPVKELWRLLDRLDLLPELTDEAAVWVPELADVAGTVVVADREWDTFTGEAKAKWDVGRGQALLAIDDKHVRLDKLAIKDDGLGRMEGSAVINLDEHSVEVAATSWQPGPRLPIPKPVPTEAILAVLPQAALKATPVKGGLDVIAKLTGTGQAQLMWAPGRPFAIDGANIPLSLLQPFLPGDVTLAAGRALKLTVVIDDGLKEFAADVEQTRVLWRGWALGTVDGKVTAHPLAGRAGAFAAEVVLPPMGSVRYQGNAEAGTLAVDLLTAEALMVRLKGPATLPDLHGALSFTVDLSRDRDAVLGTVREAVLTKVTLIDVLEGFDATVHGDLRFADARLEAHLLGQVTHGEVRLPGQKVALAERRPIFNARFQVTGDAILAENVLIRATDLQGQALPDGYSAGLRGRFSLQDQSGAVTGVIDHANLAWLTNLMPIPDGQLHGECAVTFTALLAKEGVRRVDGHFLPLDADLSLGPNLRATGIKGAVNFQLAKPEAPPRQP
jgi:hypothetical protein